MTLLDLIPATPSTLDDDTIRQFLNNQIPASTLPEPVWGPIGREVYERTYSRPLDDGRSEVWAETVRRVVLGNLAFAPEHTAQPDEAIELFRLIYEMKMIPGGRHLWVTGTANRFSRNCLAAETEVITRDGVRRIGDLAGQTVEVIDGHGGWVSAPFASYGVQALRKITLSRGRQSKTIFATADHGWFVRENHGSGVVRKRVVTDELTAGMQLVSQRAKGSPLASGVRPSPVGIQHGFVFGDGSVTNTAVARSSGSVAYFCGDKDAAMLKWFPNHEVKSRTNGTLYAPDNPRFFKSLPDISEASSYLYGWLAGYFAADGNVSKSGEVRLASADERNVRFAADVCYRLGLGVVGITYQDRHGFGDTETRLWTLSIDRRTLTPDFFLVEKHRQRWETAVAAPAFPHYWKVVSVDETDRVEEVFCCEVPTTQSFVIEGGLLTSNCWVSGWSEQPSSHFRFLASRLFEGGGVGSNYSSDLLNVLPPVRSTLSIFLTCRPDHPDFEGVRAASDGLWVDHDIAPSGSVERIVIDDSREGWVDTWCQIIDATHDDNPPVLLIDVSDLREHGAVLRTFGGTASGPAPFAGSVVAINRILAIPYLEARRLNGLEAMSIDHELASAIVAGGARRSARMSFMHWSDPLVEEFTRCKADHTSHWTTNISVEIDESFHAALAAGDNHAAHVLHLVATGMAINGEPGLADTGLASEGEHTRLRMSNPCVTGDTVVQTTSGLRRVDDLVGSGQIDLLVNDEVWSTTKDGFFVTGTKPVIRLDIDGSPLRVTADHLILTPTGWQAAGTLNMGDQVVRDGQGVTDFIHALQSNADTEAVNIENIGTISSIEEDGVETVYDAQVPGLNAFVANGTIVHNCGEIYLEPQEACNIGSVNLDAFGTDTQGALRAFELMARFLYRSTENIYPDPEARVVEGRNRRIGVGIMGLQGWCAAHGVRLSDLPDTERLHVNLADFYQASRDGADGLADALGTPRSIKVTTVAPTGTIAQMPGVTPGIHPVFARYFLRRVRFGQVDSALVDFAEKGYRIVDDVYAAQTKVVEFPLKDSILDRFPEELIEQSDEVTFPRFAAIIACVQEHFADNAVSATAQIPAGTDPAELEVGIRGALGKVKGLTVFPDVSRPLSPYERISADQYEVEIARLASLDLIAAGDSNSGECVGGACPIR
jgi:ribonucleotide reductase alpha subunit